MKFIISYKGNTAPDLKKVTAVLDQHRAEVLDSSLMPKAALIKMDAASLQELKHELDEDWDIVPEKTYQVPDTRKTLRKS
jgi:hypothetical protein